MDAFMTGWLGSLSLVWAVVTFIWVTLLGYRAWLASREEDQMFLTSSHDPGADEQNVIVAKLGKLTKPIWTLGILTGTFTLLILGVWLWQGMHTGI
jgi:hypothetical protein